MPFKVLSWNVLAYQLAKSAQFVGVSPADLTLEKRHIILLDIIHSHNADIVCLQECDFYPKIWEVNMDVLGYKGIWAEKQRMAEPRDGVAIFYKTARFPENSVAFHGIWHDNPVQAVIGINDGEHRLVVSNTHLKSKFGFQSIRLRQTTVALDRVRGLSVGFELGTFICCGDFNALPDEPCIKHVIEYGELENANPSAAWTNWKTRTKTYKTVTDYIFYSRQLSVTSVEPIPELPIPDTGLPIPSYPSDHLATVCTFDYK